MNQTELQNKLGEWFHTEGISAERIISELTSVQEAEAYDGLEVVTLEEAAAELLDDIDNPKSGMGTPINWLNRKIGGITKGEVLTIAARPGAGKSTFALQILAYLSKRHSTLYVTLEMPEKHQAARLIATATEIKLDEIIRREVADKTQFEKAVEMIQKSKSAKRMKLSRDGRTIEKVKALIDMTSAEIIVIDTVNLMKATGESERIKLTNITRELKQVALSKNVAIIMVAQLNREADGKFSPSLADIKESGSVEEDSDVVLMFSDVEAYTAIEKAQGLLGRTFCTEHEFNQMRENNRRCVFMSIRKNRNGETGGEILWYVCDKFKFVELAEARERDFLPW